MKVLAVGAALLLGGCSGGRPADRTQLAEVDQLMKREFSPAAAPLVRDSWTAGEDGRWVCGDIAAPPTLRAQQTSLRFVLVGGSLALEPHLQALDVTGAQIVAESVALFDDTWAKVCAPAAPIGRRIAGWFSGKRAAAPPETPLTNAYVEDLLRRNGTSR